MAVTRLMIAQSVAKPGKKSAKLTDSNQGTKREKGHDNLGPRSPKEGKSLRNPPGWATASAKSFLRKPQSFLAVVSRALFVFKVNHRADAAERCSIVVAARTTADLSVPRKHHWKPHIRQFCETDDGQPPYDSRITRFYSTRIHPKHSPAPEI